MEENVKIIFLSGLEIDATLNATTFIVDEEPEFPTDLTEVTVRNEAGEETVYNNAEIFEAFSDDNKYRFGIREVTADEQLRADVDYLLCLAE